MTPVATSAPNTLRDELHLHLYGCLTPEDIFHLTKDHYKERSDALDWYAAEYLKLTGTRVDWRGYFEGSAGLERLRKDFLADSPMTFAAFQARFNLMIALLPTVIYGPHVLRHVATKHAHANVRYAEHRIFVPPGMSPGQLAHYYRALATEAAAINSELSGVHELRIILSVSRQPAYFKDQYEVLRALQTGPHGPAVRGVVTGLDFCGAEEGFPPEGITGVFAQILADNQADPDSALAILYHVGESFDGMSVFSAMRWILKSKEIGAHRLGHAMAAAINPHHTARFADGCPLTEPASEAHALCGFLSMHITDTQGPLAALRAMYLTALRRQTGDQITLSWNESLRQAVGAMQGVVCEQLRNSGAVVETCPTSNRIIGRISRAEDLPVFRFDREGIPMVIASDDPGIFATSLAQEEAICRQGGISGDGLAQAAANNELKRAGLMAGRTVF